MRPVAEEIKAEPYLKLTDYRHDTPLHPWDRLRIDAMNRVIISEATDRSAVVRIMCRIWTLDPGTPFCVDASKMANLFGI